MNNQSSKKVKHFKQKGSLTAALMQAQNHMTLIEHLNNMKCIIDT